MQNPSKNSNQAYRLSTTTETPLSDGRWTLLFIGSQGKTITLKRFKEIVLFTILVLCVFIGIAAGLFLWNRNILGEKNQLEAQLKDLEKRNEALRHAKDILLTRLVVAESQMRESHGGVPEKHSEVEFQGQTEQDLSDSGETGQSTRLTVKSSEAAIQEQVKPKPDLNPSESGLRVVIENFKISIKAGNNKLRVQFKLKNISPNSQRVSGHAIVVLKGEQIPQNQWVSLPGMPLVEGKPTGKHQGHAFGISNFKSMRFTASVPLDPEKFQTAAVYVFTRSGELLFEQDFPVKLPSTIG